MNMLSTIHKYSGYVQNQYIYIYIYQMTFIKTKPQILGLITWIFMLFRVDKGYGNNPRNANMNIRVCVLENRLNHNLEMISN
jgi:hypothetical protein